MDDAGKLGKEPFSDPDLNIRAKPLPHGMWSGWGMSVEAAIKLPCYLRLTKISGGSLEIWGSGVLL
jgi:hypothetical protein